MQMKRTDNILTTEIDSRTTGRKLMEVANFYSDHAKTLDNGREIYGGLTADCKLNKYNILKDCSYNATLVNMQIPKHKHH